MAFTVTATLPGVWHIQDSMSVCFTLIAGERQALLVDAGYGLENAAAFAASLTPLPVQLWLTHGHHDHALGARWFPQVKLCPEEAPVYGEYTSAHWRRHVLQGAVARGIPADEADYLAGEMPAPALLPGETIDLGGLTAQVIPCPGHTPGSAVVFVPELSLLLTGDDWNPTTWLFFPEALDVYAYRARMEALLALPFARVLCPHDPGLQPREKLEACVEMRRSSAHHRQRARNGGARGARLPAADAASGAADGAVPGV